MQPLPMSEWRVFYEGGIDICLAMHTNQGFLHWTLVTLLKPLQNLAGGHDLESVAVDSIDGPLIL